MTAKGGKRSGKAARLSTAANDTVGKYAAEIKAASQHLANALDEEAQTLLKLPAQRETAIREQRTKTFTTDHIVSGPDWYRTPLIPPV